MTAFTICLTVPEATRFLLLRPNRVRQAKVGRGMSSLDISKLRTPPRHHLACALRCLVGCGSPNVPIGEALRGQQATKALVSLQRVVRLVRALLPEVSEQLANLYGKTLNLGLRSVCLKG